MDSSSDVIETKPFPSIDELKWIEEVAPLIETHLHRVVPEMLCTLQQTDILDSYEHDCKILYDEIRKNPSVDVAALTGLFHRYELSRFNGALDVTLAESENDLLRVDATTHQVLIWMFNRVN
jgi:hypothetical protein